ncbi:hypothetical protein SCP_0700830 [Sparassis crispa]|uniref:Uncharacterized protein n=1 Tax=Sparassis crispa TaxID=139825 RepID=A0A401GRS2_9APHY|nr:hypothetical protein SCP_0700830 [Sparassis crispa]GBE84903.1 hypothetical protein SCP_0700830 [Sparassis crispa]
MPFTDVVNTRDTTTNSAHAAPTCATKRAFTGHEDIDAACGVTKKPRIEDAASSDATGESAASTSPPNPYTILSAPCPTYIQLRFQLARFRGVYRVHAHRSEICTNVVMYSPSNGRKGEIKKYGVAPPPEPDRDEDLEEWFAWMQKWHHPNNNPVMEVVPCGMRNRRPLTYGFEEPISYEIKQNHEVTVGDVWSLERDHNASGGECANDEIAVKLLYDLGSSWEVHISVEPNHEGSFGFTYDPPKNVPIIVTAKGAPPIEDTHGDVPGELDAKKKKVSKLLFAPNSFAKYLAGEIGTSSRKMELAVYNVAEEAKRQRAAAKEREERRKQLEKEREERCTRGEESDEDDEEDYE